MKHINIVCNGIEELSLRKQIYKLVHSLLLSSVSAKSLGQYCVYVYIQTITANNESGCKTTLKQGDNGGDTV